MKKILLTVLLLNSVIFGAIAQSCVGSDTLTASPGPNSNGQYFPGQIVTYCYSVTDYAQTTADWLCGVVPTFGPGWDLTTLTPVSAPASCDGQGNWAWYLTCTSTASGQTFGPGFYYDSPAGSTSGTLDGIPGNNFGDNCQTYTWTFCFSIQVLANAPNGTDLTVSMNAYSDYTVGSWGNNACVDPPDPSNTQPATVINCTLIIPTVNITDATCANLSNGAITVIPSGLPPYSYVWNTGATTATINNLPQGVYTVTITDSTLCAKVVTIPVGGPQPILLNPTVVNNGCNANGGSITLNPSGGSGSFTFLWNDGTTGTAINNLTAGTYTVTVTDSLSCSDTSSYTITTVAPIGLTLSSTASNCSGQTGTATAVATGGAGTFTYTWSPSGGNAATASNLAPGTYTVLVTDSNGCSATSQVVVVGTGTFTLTSQFVPLACDPAGTTSATVNISGGTAPFNIQWTPFGGNQPTATGLTSGTYLVLVTDANGCIDSTTIVIPGITPVTATTSSTPVQCNTSNSGSASVSPSGNSPFTYQWSNGGATATITNVASGTYNVTVTDINGCTASFSATVGVIPDVFASAGSNATSCSGQPVTLNGSASGGTAPFSYLWSNGSSSSSPSVSPSATTTYTLTVTDANNCTATSNVIVNVDQYPVISLNAPTTICSGTSTSLQASGGANYSWSPSGDLNNSTISNPVATPATTTTYVVTVSNGQCASTDSVLITVAPQVIAGFSPDTTAGEAPLSVIFTNNSSGAVSYLWTFGDGTGSNLQSPTHTYTDHGSYTVTMVATNALGCTDTSRYSFIIVDEFAALIVPNVFTPNGDGYNDTFTLIEKGIATINVVIFNRWGREIYSWNKKNGSWDGKSSDGSEATDGTYFYIIKAMGVDDKPYNFQGALELIRGKK